MKKIASIAAIGVMALLMIAVIAPSAYADGVVPVPVPTTTVVPVPVNTGANLGTLFVLDNLFAGNSNGILSNNWGTGTSLGDLFILDQLFNGPGIGGSVNGNNLGTLFTLNALFSGNSNGVLTPGGTSLGNLFVLGQLFK